MYVSTLWLIVTGRLCTFRLPRDSVWSICWHPCTERIQGGQDWTNRNTRYDDRKV